MNTSTHTSTQFSDCNAEFIYRSFKSDNYRPVQERLYTRGSGLTERQTGVLVHSAVADLVASGALLPSRGEITTVVNCLLKPYARSARQAARVAVVTAVGSYFRHFLPEYPWSLVGHEVRVPGARLDLLYSHRDGRLFSDEVKTGRVGRIIDRERLRQQVQRATIGGQRKYGGAFIGVRAVVLGAPRTSFIEPAHACGVPCWVEES